MRPRRLHVAGVVIMLSWFASLGWLVKRQYYSTGYPPGVTTSDRLAPGSRFYAVFGGGVQLGTASLTADTLPDGVRISQRLDLGLRDSLESHLLTLLLTPSLAVRSWTADISGGASPLSVTGERDSAGHFRATLSERGQPMQTLAMEPGQALPLFSAVLRASLNGVVTPGDTLSLRVLDPFSGAVSTVSLRSIPARNGMILTDSARLDPRSGRWLPALTDTVDARLLVQLNSSRPIRLWVDRQGFPLQAELPNGLVLQRTAFEIAHLNFRNGFPNAAPPASRHHLRAPAADVPVPGDTSATIFFPPADSAIAVVLPSAFRGATSRADSAAHLARWIARRIRTSNTGDDASAAAANGHGSALGRARLFVAVLRSQNIPARLAIGAARTGNRWTVALRPQAYAGRWLTADLKSGRMTTDSTGTLLTTRTSGLRFEYDALLASLEPPTP